MLRKNRFEHYNISAENINIEQKPLETRKENELLQNSISTITTEKDNEISDLKDRIISLETQAVSAEEEWDSLKLAITIIMQEKNKGVVIQQNNVLQQEKFKTKIPKKKRQHLHQLQQNMNQKKKESEMSGTIESQNRFEVLDNGGM